MEIWLIRHGKAEERIDDLTDGQRRLVAKGEAQAAKIARYLEKIAKGKKIQFWSSPLVRAQETVKILMTPFGGIPRVQGEISEGDLLPLLNLWGKSGADVQVVVGHEPFLSEWLEDMTGIRQEFSTGSMARIQVAHLIPPKGKLLEYVEPGKLE